MGHARDHGAAALSPKRALPIDAMGRLVPMSCSQGPVLCCTGTVLTCGAFAFRIRYRCLPELSDIPPGTLRRVPQIIIVPSIMTRSIRNDSDSFSTDVGPGAPAVQCLATSSYVRSVSAMVGAASMCAALWMAEVEDRAPQPISRGSLQFRVDFDLRHCHHDGRGRTAQRPDPGSRITF